MLRCLVILIFTGLCALPLSGQENAKVLLFGGYQFLHDGNADGFDDSLSASGWNASATFQFTKHLGVAADFSGNYRSTTLHNGSLGEGGQFPIAFRAYTYTFGPVFSFGVAGRVRPFVHALFGAGHLRPDGCVIFSGSPDECGSGDYNGFTMMLGGGVDAKAAGHITYRLFQADWVYLPTTFGPSGQTGNFRISTGPVFRF